jgi:hypothetical protein
VWSIVGTNEPPRISIDQPSRNEDASGSFVFTVRLDRSVPFLVRVDHGTEDGTATLANDDYVAASGTLTFAAGQTAKTLEISVIPDRVDESTETFLVRLTNPQGGILEGSGIGVGTILDDDPPPEFRVSDVSAHVSDGLLVFRVTTGGAALQPLSVSYQTVDGTATATSDYEARSGVLTFPPKTTETTVAVPILNDEVCDQPESFLLRLSDPVGAPVADDTGVATILCSLTPTTLPLFQAEALGEGIELRWQLGDSRSSERVELQRAPRASGPWSPVDAAWRTAGSITIAVDRTVEPGHAYWYRLVEPATIGEPVVLGQLAVTAGAAPEFALSRIRPNPSPGATIVEFSLAREANVRLSVVDLQGREVAILARGVRPRGTHVATWNGDGDRGLAPTGLYFVRYRVDGRTITERLVLTR